MRSIICIAFLFFFSCNTGGSQKKPFRAVLESCDLVEIVLYNKGDTLSYQMKDTTGIKIFTGLIKGIKVQPAVVCQSAGELRYKSKEQPLLTAQFSLSESNGKENCNYVSYRFNNENYHHKLTKRALNLLQQTWSLAREQAQKQKDKKQ